MNVWSELTESNPSGKIGSVAGAGGDEPSADSTLYRYTSYNHLGADLANGTGGDGEANTGTVDAPEKHLFH